MRDQDDKLNQTGDLIDLRSLIGDADGGDYTLDDIMAEFSRPAPPPEDQPEPPPSPAETPVEEPEVAPADPEEPPAEDLEEAPADPEARFNTIDLSKIPRHKPSPALAGALRSGGKVVAFPGTASSRTEPELPAEEAPEVPGGPEEPEEAAPAAEPAPVIPFPQEESALSAFLKNLGRKADDYADRMFEEDEATDKKEVRRLERLIPGTDQEELHEEPPSRRWRRPKKKEVLPPDVPPYELSKRYGRGLKWLRTRTLFLFLLALLALAQTLLPMAGAVWAYPLDQPEAQSWLSAALMGVGILLAGDVLLTGIARACFFKFGMDTMAALACALTLADGVQLALSETPSDRLPYTLVCLTGLFFLLHGTYHKRCALRLSCRTAASASAPYRVTLDPEKWSERGAYAKWSGDSQGYGSQIQADDGAQRVFRRVCPLLLLGDVTSALLVSVGSEHPERLVWALSALFTATAAFGGALVYSRPFHKTARRLASSGAALAGWPGMALSRKGDCVLITDGDLFPPGYVELNGFKVMSDFPAERVVAYTATLIQDSGSDLARLFHDQLRAMGGLMRRSEGLECHEGGGLSGTIRGDQVLVGSAAFMKLMKVKLPQGLNVKSAVFCAIDGRLAGIFALSYALPDTVFPSLGSLLLERVEPVLATRDFNLIPAMLQQRFKLATDKMAFPSIQRRRELSDPKQDHGDILTALLCREGLLPFAESIIAAKRLRWATRLGAALCCAGSLLGLALSAYLTSVGAYTSLSPLNLLVFMLTWLAPVWFLSGWVHRF